jgi:cytochrome c5
MRNILKQLALMVSIGSTTLVLAQAPPPSKPADSSGKSAPKAVRTNQPDVGQRKFDANCGRCHSFPEQLSPSLTGTVVRHMRVRASLSAEDEKDILRFLAP